MSEESKIFQKLGEESWGSEIPLTAYDNKATVSDLVKYELLIETLETIKEDNNFNFNLIKYMQKHKEFFDANDKYEMIIDIGENNPTSFNLLRLDRYCIVSNPAEYQMLLDHSRLALKFFKDDCKLDDDTYRDKLNEVVENAKHSERGPMMMSMSHIGKSTYTQPKEQPVAGEDNETAEYKTIIAGNPKVVSEMQVDDTANYARHNRELSDIYDSYNNNTQFLTNRGYQENRNRCLQIRKDLGPLPTNHFKETYEFDNAKLFQIKHYSEQTIYEGMLDSERKLYYNLTLHREKKRLWSIDLRRRRSVRRRVAYGQMRRLRPNDKLRRVFL